MMNTSAIVGVLAQFPSLVGGGSQPPQSGPDNQTIIDLFGGGANTGFALDFTQFDGAFTSADGAFGTLPWATPISAFGTPPSTFRLVDLLGTEFTSDNDPDDNASQVSQFEQDADGVTRFRADTHGFVLPNLVSTTQNYTFGVTVEHRGTNRYFYDSASGRLIFAIDSISRFAFYDGSWRAGPTFPADTKISAICELDAAAGEGRIYINGALAATLPYTPRNLGGSNRLWSRNSSTVTSSLAASVYRQFLIDRLLTADERADLDYWLRSVIDPGLQPPATTEPGLIGPPATGDEVAARAWRVFGVIGSGNIQYSGIELRSEVGGLDRSAAGTPIASSTYLNNTGAYGPRLAFDGNTGTRWAAAGSTDQWIGIDFGDGNSMVLRQVMLQPFSSFPDQSFRTAKVQYSDDLVTWTDYADLPPAGGIIPEAEAVYTVDPAAAAPTTFAPAPGSYSDAFAQTADGTALLQSAGALSSLTSYASARKVLIARAVWNNKSAVWDSELVTFLDADKTGVAGIWRSPLQDGDTVTWAQLVKLMLIPSFTDVAETIQRVLGGELNAQDGLAANADDRFSIEVEEVISDLGLQSTIWYNANPAKAFPTAEAPLPDAVQWVDACVQVPELLSILQTPSETLAIAGPNARNITISNTSMFVNGIGPRQDGTYWTDHVGGKTGTNGTSSRAHLFQHDMPNGDRVRLGFVESESENARFHDATGLLYGLCDDFPAYAPVGADPDLANVEIIVGQTPGALDTAFPSKTVASSSPPAVITRTGRLFEYQFDFNGAEYLDLGNGPEWDLGAQDFTMETWVRGKGSYPGVSQNLFNKWYPVDGHRSFQLRFTTGPSGLNFWYSFDGVNGGRMTVNLGENFGWNGAQRHFCVQRSGSEIALFLNGHKGAAANVGTNALYSSTDHLFIGARGRTTAEDEFGTFLLDEARITVGAARYAQGGFAVPLGKFPRT